MCLIHLKFGNPTQLSRRPFHVRFIIANQIPVRDEHPWLSLDNLSHWVWGEIFTRQGVSVFCAVSVFIGMYWYYDIDKPWMLLLAPLAIVVFGFLLFMIATVSVFLDSCADWSMDILFHPPNPKNPIYQLLYLLFSITGFILVALFLTIGDPDVRGYWHQ